MKEPTRPVDARHSRGPTSPPQFDGVALNPGGSPCVAQAFSVRPPASAFMSPPDYISPEKKSPVIEEMDQFKGLKATFCRSLFRLLIATQTFLCVCIYI